MPIITTALANLIIILVIGVVAGLLFNRCGQTWLRRQFTTRHTGITSSLVGIAGSFIGFHIGVLLGFLPIALDALHRRWRRRGARAVAVALFSSAVVCAICPNPSMAYLGRFERMTVMIKLPLASKKAIPLGLAPNCWNVVPPHSSGPMTQVSRFQSAGF